MKLFGGPLGSPFSRLRPYGPLKAVPRALSTMVHGMLIPDLIVPSDMPKGGFASIGNMRAHLPRPAIINASHNGTCPFFMKGH